MDADALQTNLGTVKELILDEQKLVTYISLSKELCIHVNEAKSLLGRVIQDIRRAQPEIDLCVSYVISGLLNNNCGCTTVCSETDLYTVKKSLKIVFYEHVYGVSRSLQAVDKVALSVIDQFEDLPLCSGLITAYSCTKRTTNEIGNLKSNKNHAIIIAPKSTAAQQKSKDVEVTKNEGIKKNTEVKLEHDVKSEIPSPKVLSKNKTPTKTNCNKIATKGIAGFFSKANNGDSLKIKKSNLYQESKVKEERVPQESTNSTKSSKAINNAPIKIEKEKSNSNSNLTHIKKIAKVDSKRKRLLHVSDSESETEENNPFTNEMDVDHESEDEIPPTPTINTVKITSGIVNPKKRRKIVDKTYTDEEGYILTKKEEVYESCSDDEEETKENVKQEKDNDKQETDNINVKENITQTKENSEQLKQFKTEISPKGNKTKKKKLSPPQKGKQSTINNFFKKV